MPSTARSGATGVSAPTALSTSRRWIEVSCAIRRSQNPTVWSGGHQVAAWSPGPWLSSCSTSCR